LAWSKEEKITVLLPFAAREFMAHIYSTRMVTISRLSTEKCEPSTKDFAEQ
jgi:hypothetical protein